jgi:hypothetical protein
MYIQNDVCLYKVINFSIIIARVKAIYIFTSMGQFVLHISIQSLKENEDFIYQYKIFMFMLSGKKNAD